MAETKRAAGAAGSADAADNNAGTVEKLFVTRESFKSKGKEMYAYVVKSTLRGRDVKVELIPPKAGRNTDGAGFGVLDLVFNGAEKVDFVRTFEDYLQDGKKMVRTVYTAESKDADGEYKCPVVPARKSDQAILDMLFARIDKQSQKKDETPA